MSEPDALLRSVNADASTTQHKSHSRGRQFLKTVLTFRKWLLSCWRSNFSRQFYWHVEQPQQRAHYRDGKASVGGIVRSIHTKWGAVLKVGRRGEHYGAWCLMRHSQRCCADVRSMAGRDTWHQAVGTRLHWSAAKLLARHWRLLYENRMGSTSCSVRLVVNVGLRCIFFLLLIFIPDRMLRLFPFFFFFFT